MNNTLQKFVSENLEKPWDWNCLSENKSITPNFVTNNQDFNWSNQFLCRNPSMFKSIKINDNSGKTLDDISKKIKAKPIITPSFVKNNQKVILDHEHENRDKSITEEVVLEKKDKPLDWKLLSRTLSMTEEYINKNINLPWDWENLSRNPSIPPNFILEHPEKDWSWYWISSNTFEIVDKNIKEEKEINVRRKIAFISCAENIPLCDEMIREIVMNI
jgi:hypothetical protein